MPRQADHGRAVLVATHASASLDLCDEVVVLEAGGIAFRGSPADAQMHLAAVANDLGRDSDLESVLATVPTTPRAPERDEHRPFGLELRVLTGRYLRTLTRDRRTLALLLGQAPVLGLLIALVFHPGTLGSANASPVNAIEVVFLLMTGSIWLGVTSACREVVKERGLVEREFDVGVRLDAYVIAKALVLFALNFVQVLWLTLVVVGLQPLGVGSGAVVEIFGLAVLTAWASAAMGIAVSCMARSIDQAAGAVPLLLMPQLLLAGGLVPLAQMPRVIAGLANLIYAAGRSPGSPLRPTSGHGCQPSTPQASWASTPVSFRLARGPRPAS
jgi:ABC-type multidrug transport system permease subunit